MDSSKEQPISPDPSSLKRDPLLAQAQESLKRQVWEKAIHDFHALLKKNPNDFEAYVGLGKAYQGKGREEEGDAFLLMALEQYRKALHLEPEHSIVHDLMVSLSSQLSLLGELLNEYQAYQSKYPDIAEYKKTIQKIEALLLVKIDRPVKKVAPHRLTWILFERGLPLAIVGCVLTGLFVRFRPMGFMGANAHDLFWGLAGIFTILYLFYRLLVYFGNKY